MDIKKIKYKIKRIQYAIIHGLLFQGFLRTKKLTAIIIEPTNICNLKCSCCPHGNEKKEERIGGFMSRQTFDIILKNMDIKIKEVNLYLHGEPFLNKDLDYFVEQLNRKQIWTTIYSNGYHIDLNLLENILKHKRTQFTFSVDIFNKENYEKIRQPAKHEKIIEQLVIINRIFEKHKRMFDITMIIDAKNIENTHDICKKLLTEYSCLNKISFGNRFPWPEHFHTGELNERLSKNRGLCSQIKSNVSVYWNGDVTICSYDFSGQLVIGNLTISKLSKVYNSYTARKIRKYHYMCNYSKLPICQKCILPRCKSSSRIVTRKQVLNEKQITENS